jgi:hypothetical protein
MKVASKNRPSALNSAVFSVWNNKSASSATATPRATKKPRIEGPIVEGPGFSIGDIEYSPGAFDTGAVISARVICPGAFTKMPLLVSFYRSYGKIDEAFEGACRVSRVGNTDSFTIHALMCNDSGVVWGKNVKSSALCEQLKKVEYK